MMMAIKELINLVRNRIFGRKDNVSNVGWASELARSVRETEKRQGRGRFWRDKIFFGLFLIAIAFIFYIVILYVS